MYPEFCHPSASAFYFSHRSHGGILELTDCSFLPTLDCCDTHTCTHTHKHTHALTHRGLRHSLSHRETPPLFWKYTIAIHSAKSTHTTSCLLGYTSSTHTSSRTRTLKHARTHAHTHAHTSQRAPRPYCPSIWLVPFVPHVLSVADGKLLRAGGAVRPHDGSTCPDLLKTYVMTWDFTKHLSVTQVMPFKHKKLWWIPLYNSEALKYGTTQGLWPERKQPYLNTLYLFLLS